MSDLTPEDKELADRLLREAIREEKARIAYKKESRPLKIGCLVFFGVLVLGFIVYKLLS